MNIKRHILSLIAMFAFMANIAYSAPHFISFSKGEGKYVALTTSGSGVNILADPNDHEGVGIAIDNLIGDIKKVAGIVPQKLGGTSNAQPTIIIGSADRSKHIAALIKQGLIDGKELKGKNEKFIITTIHYGDGAKDNDQHNCIVIAGSDKRGTIYGIYELSEQIGVSPWYFWADVPIERHHDIYVKCGTYTDGEPAVKYRGIFINDEAPCLTSWVKNTYGTDFGDHRFYGQVFELILRLKGNFLWPAMWGWAFYADDPENGKLADKMGIVIGTSHHEPMARNHQEWARKRREYGAWNYSTNQTTIDKFFREGIERMKGTEDIVTIGMRGDGDEAMSKETDTKLLERIVENQRNIIRKVTGKPAKETPQVWALYKEVLDYYDAGMRVPDDVIMLLCDDNWGHVRRLPNEKERKHPGGWGMYYHVDYVGAPRNSKWLCNTPIQNMWEQLTLTYDYGVDKMWILNVGDIKPMEYSITEFLDLAWDPHAYNAANLLDHTRQWCAQQFGKDVAEETARLLNLYLKYNGRITAEMLDANTYNIESGEWAQVATEYKLLELDALRLQEVINKKGGQYADAYYQLILFPIQAMSNLYDMYYAQAMNHYLFAKGNAEANLWADRAEKAFARDAELCRKYNKEMAGGKWDGMMTQKHIGYTSWNDNFPRDRQPAVKRVGVVTDDAAFGANMGGCVFKAKDGLVAIEAEHYFKAYAPASPKACWTVIPYMGRTLSGVAVMPYTESTEGARLDYRMEVPADVREAKVSIKVKSNLAFQRVEGHRYAVSFDNGEEKIINFNGNLNESPRNIYSVYYPTVARRVVTSNITLPLQEVGGANAEGNVTRTLTLRPLDPGVVFEKITIDLDGTHKVTELGYPESEYSK